MVEQDRRNPYVILGVPFGATGEEARSGFARAARRLRNDANAPYSQADLTWALHQVEQIITNPELAFEVYRIPSSSLVIGMDHEGVFHPAPHPLHRTTQPSSEEWETVRRQALAAALRRIMADRFQQPTGYVPYE